MCVGFLNLLSTTQGLHTTVVHIGSEEIFFPREHLAVVNTTDIQWVGTREGAKPPPNRTASLTENGWALSVHSTKAVWVNAPGFLVKLQVVEAVASQVARLGLELTLASPIVWPSSKSCHHWNSGFCAKVCRKYSVWRQKLVAEKPQHLPPSSK
jgi:hypothetical protein